MSTDIKLIMKISPFILICFIPCYCTKPKTVFYWNVPPYIWKENGTVRGSMRYFMDTMETKCKQPESVYYQVKGGYKGFTEALHSVVRGQKFVDTDKGKIDTKNDDGWMPFLNVSWLKANKHSENITGEPFTFSVSKEMVVIVPRYKIEIMYKIANGFIRSFNFVILCLILTLVTGIIIWLLVSITVFLFDYLCHNLNCTFSLVNS